MEKEIAKPEPETIASQQLHFQVGSYNVKAALDGQNFIIKAYSELNGKMFEATIQPKDLSEDDLKYFGDCECVLAEVQECLEEKRKMLLSDCG